MLHNTPPSLIPELLVSWWTQKAATLDSVLNCPYKENTRKQGILISADCGYKITTSKAKPKLITLSKTHGWQPRNLKRVSADILPLLMLMFQLWRDYFWLGYEQWAQVLKEQIHLMSRSSQWVCSFISWGRAGKLLTAQLNPGGQLWNTKGMLSSVIMLFSVCVHPLLP